MEYKYIPTKFESIGNTDKVNDEFVRCSISVLGLEQVANNTHFNKESVDKATPTLGYIPVIGYMREGEFQGHGQEIVLKDDGGVEFIVKTIPYGVVIKDSARYEDMTHLNGTKESYLVTDCYIWRRYLDDVDMINSLKQSMEIMVNNCDWDENGVLQITDFSFSALCMISVEPAFELSKIRTLDKFSKSDFKAEYTAMCGALDIYLSDNKIKESRVIKKMENKIEEEVVEVKLAEETPVEEIVEMTKEPIVKDEEKIELKEAKKKEDPKTVEPKVPTEKGTPVEPVVPVNKTIPEDKKKKKVVAEKVVEEVVSVNFEAEYDSIKSSFDKLEISNNELKAKFNDITSQFETLNTEVISLREFKLNEENQKAFELRKIEVDKIIAEFSFEEEEIKDIRQKAYSNEIATEELENSLFTLEGRKLHAKKQFSAKKVEAIVEKPVVKITEEQTVKSVYGSADKYFK